MQFRTGSPSSAQPDRTGAPRSRDDYIRTCTLLRALIERRGWATAEEVAAAWPPRGGSAAKWEWEYCWSQLCRFMGRASSPRQDAADLRDSVVSLLLAREPVRIRMAGRSVDVTFRSLTALVMLARHDLARRDAERDLNRIAELAADVEQARAESRLSRGTARRRCRNLRHLHDRLYDDLLHHTRVVLANALTPNGSDVAEADAAEWLESHAPWWRQVTPADEKALFAALFASGPGRLAAMGEPPDDGHREKDRAWREDLGFWSLLGWFFREHGVSPAALSVDLAQFITLVRAGTPYFPPPSKDRVH